MSTCPGIKVDPDIAGIGVRTAFYVQSFCAVYAASLPGSDIRGSFWTLTATSLAVLLYTVIQSGMHTLTLHNAILVSYFCVLNSFASLCAYILLPAPFRGSLFGFWRPNDSRYNLESIVPASSSSSIKSGGKYSRLEDELDEHEYVPETEVPLGLRIAMLIRYKPCSIPLALQFIAVYIYAFYIWSNASTFGNQPACNAVTRFIFFGISYKVTQGGRIIALSSLSVLFSTVALPAVFAGWSVLAQAMRMGTFMLWKRAANDPPSLRLGRDSLPIIIAFLYFWLYTIAIVEATVHSAAVINGRVQWTFRQIFPLVSVMVPVSTAYYCTKRFWQALKAEKTARKKLMSLSPTSSGTLTPTHS
jgi:hypothetical protein